MIVYLCPRSSTQGFKDNFTRRGILWDVHPSIHFFSFENNNLVCLLEMFITGIFVIQELEYQHDMIRVKSCVVIHGRKVNSCCHDAHPVLLEFLDIFPAYLLIGRKLIFLDNWEIFISKLSSVVSEGRALTFFSLGDEGHTNPGKDSYSHKQIAYGEIVREAVEILLSSKEIDEEVKRCCIEITQVKNLLLTNFECLVFF